MQHLTPVPAPENSNGEHKGNSQQDPKKRITAKQSKRFFGQFFVSAIIMACIVILLTVVLDPLQFYHKSFYPAIYSNEQRYQNPGLAKNYDYDTIIIGTSMTENFLPAEVNEALDGETLKLSIRGSTADEHNAIASIALDTGNVKQVLWGLDYFSLKMGSKEEIDFPEYLYDDKWWNDYNYWFNYSIYEELFKEAVLRPLNGNAPRQLEYLYNWNREVTFGAEKVAKVYKTSHQSEAYFGLNEEPIETVKAAFNDYVLSLVKEYPDVEFNFYYPPYSVLRQKVWQDTNNTRYHNQLEMKEWMFEQFAQLPNVNVYDFQEESEWTYNLDLYKDLSHHNQDVNTWIVEAIGREDAKYKVTQDNVKSFTTLMEEQLENIVVTNEFKVINAKISMVEGTQTTPLKFTHLNVTEDNQDIFVPVKELTATLGAEMVWDQEAKSMTFNRGDRNVVLHVGSTTVETSDGSVEMAYAPELINGTTMIPLGSVFELFGFDANLEHPEEQLIRMTLTASK
ncbi:copper amine oxidase N-terminal domain-containing protein [Paenibacillus crassostreae]|uniref:Copper amine oxidase-like N-terminal domain-containing protein n=1 Tax=Paenibacillus crassostreae TaxID=1763538 RepID=A0A167BX13_9BACL|nr:copper amine oxidase N-terminal domain-containing protein [Paenibacillus crassostreae]AOZ92590.1 hypothetical protein LPB68_10315 [Paenibacillus crassostreae]OAB72540.1 hypothetical protein PNBC_16760 [Paenibacillus crassostreae]